MGEYSRSAILDIGLPAEDIDKAERHFGSSITTEKATDWILNGLPGYDPSSSSANINTAVVPYAGGGSSGNGWETLQPLMGQDPSTKSAWEDDENATTFSAAQGLAAVRGAGSRSGADLNENDYPNHLKKVSDDSQWWSDNDKGRTGRTNTPADGPKEEPCEPIDLTQDVPMQETSIPPLVSEEDEQLRKAIELSKGDQGAQSQAMSRRPSSRQQQREDDEMAQALSMSIMDMNASGMSAHSLQLDADAETALSEVRQDPDRPMALVTPPSAFLSYLPNLVHCFYYNAAFRQNLYLIRFFEPSDDALFANYARGKAVSTRKLLAERWHTDDIPLVVIQLATLQRLFAFMANSRRTRTSLADFMDAFNIQDGSRSAFRHPAQDMKCTYQHSVFHHT